MAFLDNSGDIILDAVLTDTGRYRLAKGNGSFKIEKFALGDDEINYKLYNKNHPSGSAYYDLEILQTPILEAFTNNTSNLSYKLLSIPRTNLLYLPVMRINNLKSNTYLVGTTTPQNGGFAVAVTDDTFRNLALGGNTNVPGILSGETPNDAAAQIRTDQGIDNSAISYHNTIDDDLLETQYIIEMDTRLGMLCGISPPNIAAGISFVDDDNIASYYISEDPGASYVQRITSNTNGPGGWSATSQGPASNQELVIAGPQGTALQFKLKTTLELITSDYLFDTLGSEWSSAGTAGVAWGFLGSTRYKYIDSIIKITGATTGYRLNIPVRFVKQVT